eukprot:gene9006-23745_t
MIRVCADGEVVLPGDTAAVDKGVVHLRIGPGLAPATGGAAAAVPVAAKCGVLRHRAGKSADTAAFFVQSDQTKAEVSEGDNVVGVVIGKPGENYSVQIGTSRNASLPFLAFEGATRRNRPNIQIGDTVFARVAFNNKFVDPELTCMNAQMKSNGLGLLEGGYTINCSLATCRNLLHPSSAVLAALGEHVKFETAVGANGVVWIRAASTTETLLVARAIEASQSMAPKLIKQFVRELVKAAEYAAE